MATDPNHAAIYSALTARTTYTGEINLPCVPAALDHYATMLDQLFTQLGKPLASAEIAKVRELLEQNLREGYQKASGTQIVVNYQVTTSPTLKKNLGLRVGMRAPTLNQEYSSWSERRGEVLFGSHADARVLAVASELNDRKAAILDVGAGPGRNSIPLAQQGFTVDAVDMSPEFCAKLQEAARIDRLPIRVVQGDIVDTNTVLIANHYQMAFASEVVSHFRFGSPLPSFLRRMSEVLRPGGKLLFNIFLPRPGYQPDALAREMSEVAWGTLFSRDDVIDAMRNLPLKLVSDVSVYDYEKQHLPASAWPPTGWFEAWTQGQSVFPFNHGEQPPIEMRWLLFEKSR